MFCDHRPPVLFEHRFRQAGPDKHIDSCQITNREITAIVHVEINIQVVGKNTENQGIPGVLYRQPRFENRSEQNKNHPEDQAHITSLLP